MYADPGNVPSGHSSTLQTESSTQDRQPQPPNYERPRLPPRRATQACLVCRQRRVRCDVSFKEGDCTNCMLDDLECIVVSSKRRARRTPNEKTLASSSSNQPRTGNESPQGPQQTQYGLQTSRVRRENDLVIRYTERTFLDDSPYIPQQSSQHRSEIRLPGYIETLNVQKSEDLEFLQRRGVFDLLPLELAQIALSRYEELVYPVLPILDTAELRSAISGETGHEISLLLYHAVMVMALSCTESETVLQLAHMAKGDLRSASYEKAKALFDMGAEQDRMVLCQSCLLLADRDFYTDARDGSYWVGNAILHANYLGLYREVGTTPGSWNTRKILWWCVVMKECDISTYENYAPRVSPFVSPMLALSDFGFEDISMDGDKTASIYIIRAKRCCQLYLVKRQMYDEIQPWNGPKSYSTLRAPRQQLLSQLHSWESDTPSELRSETLQHEFDSRLVGLTCASAMAEIIYWSAYFFIYMPDLRFRVQPSRRIETVVDPEGRPIIRHAASQVAAVVERLLALNMGQSLTAPHAWNIAAASFVLLQDTQALDPVIRENALHNLEVCHRAAHTLSEACPILSQLTLGFQPAEWQPYEFQPRTESSSSSNPPTGVDNEGGPGWKSQEESTEQTYATNSRLDSRYTKLTGCQVGDVLGWVSLG